MHLGCHHITEVNIQIKLTPATLGQFPVSMGHRKGFLGKCLGIAESKFLQADCPPKLHSVTTL